MVTIRRQTAIETKVPSLAQRLTNFRTTNTCLRGSTRVNSYQHAPGTLSLVREHIYKGGPSGVAYRLTCVSSAQPAQVQVFDCNQSVFFNQRRRQPMMKIGALITDVCIYFLKKLDCLAPAIQSFFTTRHATLRNSQPGLGLRAITRIVHHRSIRESSKSAQANVHAGCPRGERERLGINVANVQCKPASGPALYRQRLYRPLNWTVYPRSNAPDLRYLDSAVNRQPCARLPECQTVIALSRSETRIASLSSVLNPLEKSIKGALNTLEYIFKHVRVDRSNIVTVVLNMCQLASLIKVRDPLLLKAPGITTFLQGRIIEFGAKGQLRFKNNLLPSGWIDAVAIGF